MHIKHTYIYMQNKLCFFSFCMYTTTTTMRLYIN